MFPYSPVLAVFLAAPLPAAPPSSWPLAAEALIAAHAVEYAPPDFKRQLVRNRARLVAGVKDAAAAETGARDLPAQRAVAAKAARAIAQSIRRHAAFADVAYETGRLVHEVSQGVWLSAGPFEAEEAAIAARRQLSFLGFGPNPFAEPELLVSSISPRKGSSAREAVEGSVTVATRLLAWIWKTAGGDSSIVRKSPEASGPYPLRSD